MTYYTQSNITKECDYSIGGVSSVFIVDINDFIKYEFKNDLLYNTGLIEKIYIKETYTEISTTDQSVFTETFNTGIYTQSLSLFVSNLRSGILSSLLNARFNKHLITFKTGDDKAFSFGSDGGSSISFSQTTGKRGDSSGYNITINKNSIYPLFEVKLNAYNKNPLWLFEDGILQENGVLFRNGILK